MPQTEQIKSQKRAIEALTEKMKNLTSDNMTLRANNDDLSRENKTLVERLRAEGL